MLNKLRNTLDESLIDLSQDIFDAILEIPFRVMGFKFADVADPPDMVPDPVVVAVVIRQFLSRDFLAKTYGFEDGAVRIPRTASIVNFSRARGLIEMPEHIDEIIGVNVVPHLLPHVPMDRILIPGYRAFHEVSKKSMELCSTVTRTGQASSPEGSGFQTIIFSVFLHENVGRDLAGPKQ